MFVLIVLATVCLASSPVIAAYDKPYYEIEDAENLFKDFIKEHNKVYNREEYYERLQIFKETLKDINERNAIHSDTVFAVNHFADLKPHEREQYCGFKPSNNTIKKVLQHSFRVHPVPVHFDWRVHNAVSHVKNQLNCSSGYIFSAIGNIEGQYAIKHGECMYFSEGQALDCLEGGSCHGGRVDEVMLELYWQRLEREVEYPYKPAKGSCKAISNKGIAEVTGVVVQHICTDEEDLLQELLFYGPLSIAIDAQDLFQYKGGILVPVNDNKPHLSQAMLLVGYGEEKGIKFWTIKNSWGEDWGEWGYVRIVRGKNAYGVKDDVLTTFVK